MFVCPELDVGFFQTVLIETLRTRFNKRGYLGLRQLLRDLAARGEIDETDDGRV